MNDFPHRSTEEMMNLIIGHAKEDESIRAVYMNGSRANPNVKPDEYQDYDIVYVVTHTDDFLADKSWVHCFGEPAIIQEPDSNDMAWGADADNTRGYTWLMLFKDGNRIDLHIQTVDAMQEEYGTDTLTVPILDKDGILVELPDASDRGYYIKKPTKEQFAGCCNEFWWCLNNVAKGIRRDQLPYALRMYNTIVHIELEKMVEWNIAMKNDFSVTTGMWGKYFKDYLSGEVYKEYLMTYVGYTSGEDFVHAILTACSLFRQLACEVAHELGYTYNMSEDTAITAYLQF